MEIVPAEHPASDLPPIEAAVREALAREPDVHCAWLFGSAARREPFRDLDIAVMVEPGAFGSLVELGRLSVRLARALPVRHVDVDLVDIETCALPMVARILDEGQLLLDRSPLRRRHWEMEATLRWLDFEPTWSIQRGPRGRGR